MVERIFLLDASVESGGRSELMFERLRFARVLKCETAGLQRRVREREKVCDAERAGHDQAVLRPHLGCVCPGVLDARVRQAHLGNREVDKARALAASLNQGEVGFTRGGKNQTREARAAANVEDSSPLDKCVRQRTGIVTARDDDRHDAVDHVKCDLAGIVRPRG